MITDSDSAKNLEVASTLPGPRSLGNVMVLTCPTRHLKVPGRKCVEWMMFAEIDIILSQGLVISYCDH